MRAGTAFYTRTRLLIAGLALALTVLSGPAQLAAAPAKGTEILWDTWGIPHISAPDHASLFFAYGYAQMEAHSELLLRLYAQARGRGAEIYGEQYLAADRWVRTNGIPARGKEWAKGQSPQFGPLIVSFVDGLNTWAKEHQADLSAEAKLVLPVSVEDVYAHGLRVIHYDWIISPSRLETRLRRAEVETHGSNEWAIAPSVLGDRQSDADEQLAPAVGRHSHLFRGPAERARRDVVRRRVGRLPGVAPMFHRDTRLDADDQQSVRVGSVSAHPERRRLRARRRRQAIRRLA